MQYVFQNCDKTKTVVINSQEFPDAYLFINQTAGLCFELLDRKDLDKGIFTYNYNDYVVIVKSDIVTIWSPMARFNCFVEDIREYFENKERNLTV